MPLNTTYNPDSIQSFSKKALNFNGTGLLATVAPGISTSIDLKLTDDHLITGIEYIAINSNFGDYLTMQIVDRDGVMVAPGTVLNQFATNWYIVPITTSRIIKVPYPAKIFAGLVIRFIYTSVGTGASQIAINLELHKVLI